MTTYSPYLGETGPGTNAGDSDAYSMGVELLATAQCWITHVHWWQAAAGSAKSTATRTGALFQIGGGDPNLSGTQNFPATVDGWNTLELSTPVELAAGTHYKAVVCHPAGGYSADSTYYSAGAGSTNTAFGPTTIVSAANANSGQNSFAVGATMTYPTLQFNATRYWVTYTVSDTDPAATVTGVLAGAVPALAGDLAGELGGYTAGVLAGSVPALTGSLSAGGITGVIAAGAGNAIPGEAIPGEAIPGSYGAGNLPALGGSLEQALATGAVGGTVPALTGSLTGTAASVTYPIRAGTVIDHVERYRAGVVA